MPGPDRASWERTWADVARVMQRRSACSQKQVGAVVVTAGNVLASTGYNGQPSGIAAGCETCPRRLTGDRDRCTAVHAEVNALLRSTPAEREGGTIYVTGTPCWSCALAIANSGLARVVRVDPNLGPGRTDAAAVVELLERSGLTEECAFSVEVPVPDLGDPHPVPTVPGAPYPIPGSPAPGCPGCGGPLASESIDVGADDDGITRTVPVPGPVYCVRGCGHEPRYPGAPSGSEWDAWTQSAGGGS